MELTGVALEARERRLFYAYFWHSNSQQFAVPYPDYH